MTKLEAFQIRGLEKDIQFLGGGAKVAEMLGCDRVTPYRWMKGVRDISLSDYRMIRLMVWVKQREAGLSESDYESIEEWIQEIIDNRGSRTL